ncbi:hypothetical protein ONZ45_g616 [Pleurotus djamor]|nr:hypothetical protein ONZ45_g616 [Pleurotus djamor]
MAFKKLRRLFSRQNLKENLDNETIFGPADVYSSSDDSTSPTISGLTPTPPLPEHTNIQAEGYFDEVGFAIPQEQFINPINVGIALAEEDHEQDWDAGRQAALSPRDCLELLAVGRHLRDCRFHMEYAGSSNLDDLPLFAHPLQSLYVSSQEPLGDFFDHLFLPQLETLGVSARWTADRSLPTWSQQQCLPMSDVELLECLLYLSDTLNTLEIYVVGGKGAITITDIAINALTSHDYHNILCPQLENITLSGCVRAADGLLAAMVASRRHGLLSRYFETRQLKHVEVAFPTSNHDRDIFYLKSLQKGGLEGEVVQGYRSGSH